MVEKCNNYPTVFIHGFMGWGSNDKVDELFPYWGFGKSRDLMGYLKKSGYEVYNPSLGPWQSAWDRACELWAMIVGERVDYGKVHSAKHNHERYGKTYKALIPDWGQLDNAGKIKKINIIGHSFGGPTVRMFTELLARGSQEEKDGTPENELSELFKGGRGKWIHTVTTLAGVNNGSVFASFMRDKGVRGVAYALLSFNVLVGETPMMGLIDLHTQQWGTMGDYKGGFKVSITPEKKYSLKKYADNFLDNIGYEMQVRGMKKMNENIQICDDVYYFAYRACRTKLAKDGIHQVPKKDMSVIAKFPLLLSGKYTSEEEGIDESWFPGDGFVAVLGASAPENEPSTEYFEGRKVKPGIWYNMPIEEKDHLSYMGVGEKKKEFFKFYTKMLDKFKTIPDAS